MTFSELEALLEERRPSAYPKKLAVTHNHFRLRNGLAFHFKVESQSRKTLFYDVVIRFRRPEDKSNDLSEWPVEVFANHPGFVYRLAYVFNDKGMIIGRLKGKIGGKAYSTPPDRMNPKKEVFYDKGLSAAVRYMRRNRMFNARRLGSKALGRASWRRAASKMRTFEKIMSERERLGGGRKRSRSLWARIFG